MSDPVVRATSPREEGELEDGELSDDSVRPDSPLPVRHRPSFLGYSHQHRPRPQRPSHGYRPKEQYRPPLRAQQQQQQGDNNQRLSFWERSHDTLGRFRSRGWAGRARGGRFWDGGWRDRAAKPSGQRATSSFARGDPSPRKPKTSIRSPNRKSGHISRNENSAEESFEDLLLKYKQIKLELESINKDEKLALSLKEEIVKGEANVVEKTVEPPVQVEKSTAENAEAIAPKDDKPPVKTFQAFEIKPLRQKLKPVTEQKKQKVIEEAVETEITNDLINPSQDSSAVEGTVSCDGNIPKEPKKPVEEEEELSELHLRLLALQSASKKWQQKEQLVMKESKEKLTKPKIEIQKDKTVPNSVAKKINSPGYAAKQEIRRQRTKAWKKLQQQKDEERRRVEEEERKKQAEEEERKKREEEIRKIRDLSNQEEQYNRFMKLVGDKARRSKSLDTDQRRSDKQCAESAGGIYQYDNYEEVAMDTDSETNSPDSSPGRHPYASDHAIGYIPSVLCVTEQFHSGILPHESKRIFQKANFSESPEIPLSPPPLPPEEPEQPPKPPFADEEEEEEMLLREELLKSLATKRAYKPEEPTSHSQPSSPPVLNNIMPVPRITLTSTSINSASHHRKTTTQIVRVLRPIRRAIKLPKHKSVVVTLNASDDSDSDGEPIDTNHSVFGGLESMIKEARRTAEASMPRAQSKSEKENDPMRTPDALPDDKKIEYRLLKEEIASREKQKLLKCEQSKGSLSPADSDMETEGSRKPVVNTKILEVEAKHKRHMMLLLKDESVLKHLLQQEAKKNESIKTAELKITRLTEQMQVTEKFLNANRMFLKNLQEQITRVQLRVQEKKTLALKYSEELARTKALISQEMGKRKLEQKTTGANKIFKNDITTSPVRESAEAIAKEKKRLQLLEQEYALKILKLKEMQSQKLKEQTIHHHPVIEETPEFVLPQPSLLDLSQDKITLDAEENDEDEELTVCVKERRRSFRDNSVTKPNLKHTEHTPNKDSLNKPSIMSPDSSELFLGLKIEELRSLYSNTHKLEELLLEFSELILPQEKCTSGKEIPVDVDIFPAKQTDTRPLPFGPYKSPLLVFKSYRFSPYFRTKEKLLLSSVSYSNMIEPKTFFCRFDLTGTCNDDDCQWQHMRDCTLSRKQLFQDILSYNLDLIGCSEKSTDEEIQAATEKYVDKVFGVNWDRMSMDQMSILLVSYVNESNKHMPPHTTYKERRKWKPAYWRKPLSDTTSSDEEETLKADSSVHSSNIKTRVPPEDAVVTPNDIRYFTNETDNIFNLEASVLENPQDIQLWVKLAYKCLHQSESSPSECLDSSLNVLSRALEHNRENSEIWCHYLKLFSKRCSREELQEMCETAVEYASSYDIWWSYLSLENSFDGKDSVCSRTLQYLMDKVEEDKKSDLISLQLLEMLLYRVHLSLITGRLQNALALFQNALKCPNKKSIADHLTLQDRCLAWLSYIHLMEFNSLPAKFYEPTNTNPSRIVNKEPFLMPWLNSQSVTTDPAMLLAVFEAAVSSCCDENLTAEDGIEICLPLYKNMIKLYLLLSRPDEAVELCLQLLQSSMANCDILEALSSVYVRMAQPEKAVDVWITAFRNNIQNPKIFYYTCKFLVSHNHLVHMPSIMNDFISSFFDTFDEEHSPTDLLRYLLNFSVPLNFKAPAVKASFNGSVLQIPYMWLVFCLWQSINSSTAETVEAYEAALGVVMQQEVLQRLWMDYLVFTNSKIVGAKNKVQEAKHFSDLVNRCLMTVPTRHLVPFSTSDYWTNYEFHNSVIYFYLSCIPKAQHSKILEQLLTMMPTNLGLALRVLKQELEDNNNQNVKMQSKMFTYNFSMCLPIWKIAIAVETFLKGHKEVHQLYQRALQKMPFCAALWKDQLLFEASGGGKTDNLRKLVSKCQEVGVSLDELLNINTESRSR